MGRGTRSALKRIGRSEKINEFFDLDIRNIRRTNDYLELDTSQGEYQLIPTNRDEGFLIFLFSAQLSLKHNGFSKFSSLYQSKDAYPYIKYRGQMMILEEKLQAKEFTYTSENIKKAMETLASFHLAARRLNPMPGSEFKVAWGKWPDRCFQEVNDLVKQKLLVRDRHVQRFDQLFWQQVDRLIERGLMAWQRFNHENYRQALKKEMEVKAFNLHSYKKAKIKLVDDQVYITDMNRIRFELQVADLACFLNDILRESNFSGNAVANFVEDYHKICPLNDEEWTALHAFLFYPKDMFRLIRHFYRNQRTRDGLQRLENFITFLDREEELITHLEMFR